MMSYILHSAYVHANVFAIAYIVYYLVQSSLLDQFQSNFLQNVLLVRSSAFLPSINFKNEQIYRLKFMRTIQKLRAYNRIAALFFVP